MGNPGIQHLMGLAVLFALMALWAAGLGGCFWPLCPCQLFTYDDLNREDPCDICSSVQQV